MQDGRREAIHNPPQGKATQGGEQHGYQPSEKWTNPTTRAYGGGGGKGEEIKRKETKGVQAGHKSFQSSAFPLGPDETPSKSSASTSSILHAFVLGLLSCVSRLLNVESGRREKIQRKYG